MMSEEKEQTTGEDSERTCVGCRQVCEPDQLERFVLYDGHLVHDVRGKAPGRGAWVMPRRDCLERALKGGFQRSFRQGKLEAPALDELVETMQQALLERLKQGVQVGVRARHLAIGAVAVSEAMKAGEVELVWVASQAGDATRQKFLTNASRKEIAAVDDLDGHELGSWLGREFVAVLGVKNRSRAARMTRDLQNFRDLVAF